MNIDQSTRDRVATIINAGLVQGLGTPRPGELCLEAAICLALGEPHSDRPSCVAAPDRAFAIRLQDAYPGTPAERAALFLPLGLAHLGTAGTDRTPWLKRLTEGTIRKVLPVWMRNAAKKLSPDSAHRTALLAVSLRCENEGTEEAARAAKKVARAYAADAADAAYADAAYAAYAAYAAADAAYDYASSAASASAAADAAAYAADAADAAYADADTSLRRQTIGLSVAVALEAYAAEGRS